MQPTSCPLPSAGPGSLLEGVAQTPPDPAGSSAVAPKQAGPLPGQHPPAPCRRVLIADDEPYIRNFCRYTLEAEGCRCDQAGNGVLALQAARTVAYDLVLLDIDMPEMSGKEVLRPLRQVCPSPNLKVIMFSGGVSPDELAQMLSDGADDYLAKPFSAAELCGRVQAALRLKEAQDRSELLNQRLAESYKALEIRVLERTAALLQANQELQREINERKQLEAQLVHAQKMESIGQLAAGIAHEINTPIQYIGDNTKFLQDAFADLDRVLQAYGRLAAAVQAGQPTAERVAEVQTAVAHADLEYLHEEIPKAVQQSLSGVESVAKIVRAMKEFSHPGGQEKTAIDINHAIENTITVARNEWKYVAEIVRNFDPSLPPVPCLPGELNQVVLNLIINAAHAIGERVGAEAGGKGTITVSTRRQDGEAEIRIADTGCGIPEAVRSRIFDPFFTTKPVGKGTGQGLAIAHSVVVKKHGGTLHFETEVNRGTTFIIRLPLKTRLCHEGPLCR